MKCAVATSHWSLVRVGEEAYPRGQQGQRSGAVVPLSDSSLRGANDRPDLAVPQVGQVRSPTEVVRHAVLSASIFILTESPPTGSGHRRIGQQRSSFDGRCKSGNQFNGCRRIRSGVPLVVRAIRPRSIPLPDPPDDKGSTDKNRRRCRTIDVFSIVQLCASQPMYTWLAAAAASCVTDDHRSVAPRPNTFG